MLADKTVTFIGAGSMAESIIAGLVAEDLLPPKQIIAINHSNQERLHELEQTYGITTSTNHEQAIEQADIILLAVKPKQVEEALYSINSTLTDKHVIISVLAGISTEYISSLIENSIPVIRTMPNTSAKVGASATAISAGKLAKKQHLEEARLLFSAIGTVTILDEEKLHTVTGISGSGPAYLYYIVEAMEQVAVECGLDENEAKTLIVQTLYGASKRLQHTDQTPESLYREVMSPGGTTEAAFNYMIEHKVQQHFKEGMKQSIQRSKELGQSVSKPSSV